MLNLITGVFVEQTLAAAKADYAVQMEREVAARKKLIEDLKSTFQMADEDKSGLITENEYLHMIQQNNVVLAFKKLGVPASELPELFKTLDADHEGSLDLDEFVKGCVALHQEMKPRDLLHIKQLVHAFQKQSGVKSDRILKSIQHLAEKVNNDIMARSKGLKAVPAEWDADVGRIPNARDVEILDRMQQLEVGQVATQKLVEQMMQWMLKRDGVEKTNKPRSRLSCCTSGEAILYPPRPMSTVSEGNT